MGLNERAVEQTLTSYLLPSSASSLKAPKLPTRPVKLTSSLVVKAYTATRQAGTCLHNMAVLQAYQANLLKDLDDKYEEESDVGTQTCRFGPPGK